MQIRGEGTGGFAKGKALVVTAKESLFGDFPEGSILVVEGISLEDSGKMDFSNVTTGSLSSGMMSMLIPTLVSSTNFRSKEKCPTRR